MIDERFKALLQQADAEDSPALPPAGEMVRRVEVVAQRQSQRRAITVAVAVPVVLAVIGLTAWRRLPNTSPIVPEEPAITANMHSLPAPAPRELLTASGEVEQALQELATIEAEANLHLQIARRMIAERERDATWTLLRQAMAAGEPADAVRERLDLVAYRMIARADRLRSEPQPNEDPTEIYREVVRLFPTTDSAVEARLRLAELTRFNLQEAPDVLSIPKQLAGLVGRALPMERCEPGRRRA